MGRSPASVVQSIADGGTGSILIIFDQQVVSGPTSQVTDWVATGGAGGNPTTVMLSIGRIILQNNAWNGLNMPSSIAYTYPGGERFLTNTPGFVPSFSTPTTFP